jgi:hypothetical protein
MGRSLVSRLAAPAVMTSAVVDQRHVRMPPACLAEHAVRIGRVVVDDEDSNHARPGCGAGETGLGSSLIGFEAARGPPCARP